MADLLNRTVISQTDANNNTGTSPSFPENMPAAALNDNMRALQGAIARWVDQICATITSAGSASAYTLTYTVAPVALYDGQRFLWIPHVACSATPTLNINSKGAKAIRKVVAGVVTDLAANDIYAGNPVDCVYRSSLDIFEIINFVSPTSVPDASSTVKGIIEIATRAEVQAGTSALLSLTPDTLAALLMKGSDVAGGTTITLGDGAYFVITGSSFTCTSIVFSATSAFGRRATLKFTSAGGILTHSASLILPTSANITIAAGDTLDLVYESSGVIRVTNYTRASGSALTTVNTGTAVYKSADTSRASTTTLATDPHLTFVATANKTYDIDIHLQINCGATGGFKFDLSGSVAISRIFAEALMITNGVNATDEIITSLATSISVSGASTTVISIHISGTIVAGGSNSTISLRWAQVSSSATNTTLLKESYLKYIERP